MQHRIRGALPCEDGIAGSAGLIRALGHPLRLRLVEALGSGEQCVSDLQALLHAPQTTVSQQLAKLRSAGIVACRRDGAHVRYRVADERVLDVLHCLRQRVPAARINDYSTRGIS